MGDEAKVSGRGAKFDSSIDKGSPFAFQIGKGKVIRGWETMIPKMTVGEKAELLVPSAEAYGSAGMKGVKVSAVGSGVRIAGNIPANSDLLFEIELLKVY